MALYPDNFDPPGANYILVLIPELLEHSPAL